MKKIQYNIYIDNSNNASGKAKKDVSHILSQYGFRNLYSPSKYRCIRILQQFFSIVSIPSNSIVFIQYHANISFFYKLLSKLRKVRKYAIIHDIESLRGNIPLEEEIKILNFFDIIISHNPSMTDFLIKNGVKAKIFTLDIFDYLISSDVVVDLSYESDTVFFAGNLQKSEFLKEIGSIRNLRINLYGATFEGIKQIIQQKNVSYKGSYSPEKLISNIEGAWGLVWDGKSISTCDGINGLYLRYNCPHKVSMCIVSERPVVIWKEAAMSKYITENKLGIAINSLTELPQVLSNISNTEYEEILQNVKAEKLRLIKGDKLKGILNQILNDDV